MMRFLSLLMVVGLSQCAFGDTSGYNFYLLTEKEEIPLVNVELLGEQQIKNQIAAVFTTLDEHDDAVQSKIIEAYKLSGDTSVIVLQIDSVVGGTIENLFMNIQKTSTLISDTLTHLLAAHNISIANLALIATSGPGAQMANLASQNILKGSGEGVTQITLMNRAGQKNANGVLMGSLYSQQLVNGATECVLNLDVLNQLQSGKGNKNTDGVNLRDVTRNRTFDPDYQMCLEECEKIFGTVGIILIQSKVSTEIEAIELCQSHRRKMMASINLSDDTSHIACFSVTSKNCPPEILDDTTTSLKRQKCIDACNMKFPTKKVKPPKK